MIFRLSQKLATKLKEGNLPSVPLDENPYADWSAHLFLASRSQYIIMSNTKSLYSVVMHGRGITDDGTLIDRALSAIREFKENDGLAFLYQRFIAPSGGSVQFAKALDRSVTGSMNDLVKQAKFYLEDGDMARIHCPNGCSGCGIRLVDGSRAAFHTRRGFSRTSTRLSAAGSIGSPISRPPTP